MDIIRQDIDELEALITIKIEPTDYEPRVKEHLKKLGREANLRGFRKGHVPMNVLKRMFGKRVLSEEVIKLVNDNLNKYLEEEGNSLLGRPVTVEDQGLKFDINNKSDYNFEFELGLRPQFDIALLKDDSDVVFTKFNIEITEDQIDEEISRLRKSHGGNQEAESIANENDLVRVSLIELDDSAEPKENGIENSTSLLVKDLKDSDNKEQFKGLSTGESMMLNVFDAFDKSKEEIAKFVLGAADQNVDDISPLFRITLDSVSQVAEAELDEAFYQKVFGEDTDVDSEAKLREKVSESLVNFHQSKSNQKLVDHVIDELMTKAPFELPQNYCEKLCKQINQENEFQKQREDSSYKLSEKDTLTVENLQKSLTWELIRGKIVELYDIEVDNDDVTESIRQDSIRNAMYYFGQVPDANTIEQMTNKLLENREYVNSTYLRMLDSRVAETLVQNVKTKEESISLQDFNELT